MLVVKYTLTTRAIKYQQRCHRRLASIVLESLIIPITTAYRDTIISHFDGAALSVPQIDVCFALLDIDK